MKSPTMQHVRHIASNKRHQHKRVALLSVLAVLVVLGVVHALLLNGRAATKQEQVLSCPVTGTVAHHHDDNCYDAEGKLVCKLPEVERHVHDDSCYREERTLACGQAEVPAHWHDDSCYDEEGNLVCGLEETAGHTHSDSCYKVERTLVCGKEEVTEEHQHGPGCFKTVTTEVADDDPMPEQTFEHHFTDKNDKLVLKVFVDAPEGALPKGATMKAEWVPQKKLDTDLIDEAVAKKTDGKVNGYQAVDITFLDTEGNEIEPAKKVTVTLTSGKIADDDTKPVLVHVESEKEAIERAEAQGKKEVKIEAQAVKPLSSKQLKKRDLADRDDQLVFDSDQFSVYAIVYTVDFKWEVNGKEYSFSLPGGGFVSFTSLSEALGIAREASGENEKDSDSEANDLQTENRASLNDIEISELTKEFVSDVEKLTFSNPELVWVGKAENDSTVGGLKEANGLECEYSAELTEEQIAEINAQTVKAGDWALISMHPFLSEESLTVTMKNGDQFIVRVTDAQDPYGLDGQNFVIIVNGNKALNPVSETERINEIDYNFLNNATPSSGSNLSWHFEFDQEAFDGHGGYYISHEGQYLKMVGTDQNDTSRTVCLVSDKADATPINIVYDKAAGKYSFSNTTGSTGGYLCQFNNDYFGVAGSSENNANAWMELRNPENYSVPGFVSPWDVLGDNIKIKLFDYTGTVNGSDINSKWASGQGSPSAQNYRDGNGVNKGRTLLFTGSGRDDANDPYNYYTGKSPAVMQGIVSNHLGDDGYPELTHTEGSKGPSLGYLFGAGGQEGVTAYTGSGGNGLAGLLRKDENGYYYYSSEQNYATLVGNEIKIYSESYDKDNASENARKIGFFPFDPYRKGESKAGEEKGPNGSPYNHQFGMTMEANFVLPPGGKLPNGEDMVFNFSGDDDVWVFIDDVLVLDLGGVHQPLSGTINFAGEGYSKVTDASIQSVPGQTTVGSGKTLAQLFKAAGEEYDDSPYSQHTIKFFYLERGGCDSNCTLSFNLPLVLGAGEVTIVKKNAETGTDPTMGFIEGAEFGIWKNADCTGDPIATATSATDGKLSFSKLAIENMDTKYYLKEITAPTGFLLSDEIYTLSVGEKQSNNMYSFNITDSSGTSVATIDQLPALPMIVNKPSKIDATKVWQQGGQAIADDSRFQVKLTLMKGGQPATSSDTSNEVTRTVSGNGTASWMLKNSNVNNYTVKETAVKLPWMSDFVEIGDTNPYGGVVSETAEDGFIVTNNIPTTDLSVTKEWKDGTTEHADRVFDEAKQIGFTLYQKLDGGEPTVYTAYGTNGKGTIAYTPAAGSTAASWSEVNIQNLPTYVYDQASNQWKKATYYVVEDPNAGVNITYKKSGDQPGDSAEGAGVSADDEQRAITIVNTDLPASFELVKVEKGKPDKKIPGAVFTLRRVKATAPYDYAEDKAVTKTTDANGQITFDNLIEGYYEVKETKLPAGYINAGQEACYIKVSAGTVVLVEKDNNGWKEVYSVDDGKFTYIAASEQTPAKITVENTPGAELPAAGGVGNAFTNILGAMAISAVVFTNLLRRRLGVVHS